MAWERQHPVETIVEWSAPVPLAVAVAWAGPQFGLSTIEYVAAAVAALAAGFAILRKSGNRARSAYAFEPSAFEPASDELGELLLEAKDEVLMLDDPLVEAEPDSRVVQLFARQEPTPGELVNRISDFLGEPPRQSAVIQESPPADASTALHAALANIRASLR